MLILTIKTKGVEAMINNTVIYSDLIIPGKVNPGKEGGDTCGRGRPVAGKPASGGDEAVREDSCRSSPGARGP